MREAGNSQIVASAWPTAAQYCRDRPDAAAGRTTWAPASIEITREIPIPFAVASGDAAKKVSLPVTGYALPNARAVSGSPAGVSSAGLGRASCRRCAR